MRIKHLAVALAAGLALTFTACSSDDSSATDSAADDQASSQDAGATEGGERAAGSDDLPAASVSELLLTPEEMPTGSSFSALPAAAEQNARESMALPEGVVVDPPECIDAVNLTNAFAAEAETATIAGNGDGGMLMLADVVVKNGPSVSELRTRHEQCPKVGYSLDSVSHSGTTTVADGPKVDGALNSVEFTMDGTTETAGTSITMKQYGIAAELRGVIFLVSGSSMNGSVSDEVKAQVLEIANAQAAKIAAAS